MQDCCCDPLFQSVLKRFDSDLLSSPQLSICGIWKNFSIAYLNPGWYHFAQVNMGEPQITQRWKIGDNLLSGIHGPIREFFQQGYERCLRENRPWQHEYECSTATLFRQHLMIAYPVNERAGILIFHNVSVVRPHDQGRVTYSAFRECYADDSDHLHQCSYCRRFRRQSSQLEWDWIPYWIENPPERLSHGICNICASHYLDAIQNGENGLPPFEVSEPA